MDHLGTGQDGTGFRFAPITLCHNSPWVCSILPQSKIAFVLSLTSRSGISISFHERKSTFEGNMAK